MCRRHNHTNTNTTQIYSSWPRSPPAEQERQKKPPNRVISLLSPSASSHPLQTNPTHPTPCPLTARPVPAPLSSLIRPNLLLLQIRLRQFPLPAVCPPRIVTRTIETRSMTGIRFHSRSLPFRLGREMFQTTGGTEGFEFCEPRG